MGKQWKQNKVRDFNFLGSKITADGDCSHEIKRCLLLGRKAMTNLESILKSRVITLQYSWNYESCHVGPPKTDGSWWRVLPKHDPLEKGMANHFSILALRTPWTVWKGKKDMTLKEELPRSVGAQYATGEKSRNNTRKNKEMEPKWKQHPVVAVTVMEVKFDAIKNNIA